MDPVGEPTTGVVALLLDDLAPTRLGTLLRGARKQRALTRREVAHQVGTTASDLRRFERGEAPVPPSLVAALAECYGEDLTAQLATRTPIQIEHRRVIVGAEEAPFDANDDDDSLGAYVAIIARLRNSAPGDPIALRTDDLVALSNALGREPAQIEARIVELLGCTPSQARSLHSELLRRKLVIPVAGLMTGLAVVTGVGIAAAAPGSSHGNAANTDPPVSYISAAATQSTAPPTTVAPAPTVAPTTTTTTPPTAPAPAPSAPAAPTPAATPETTPAKPEATPAKRPVSRPVVTPDTTPMSIPPNETVTIIQP